MKNLLIIGATSDMAQAIARKYASEGWSLTLAARDRDQLESLASDLRVRTDAEVATVEFEAEAYQEHEQFYRSLPTKPYAVIAAFGYMGDQIKARSDFEEIRKTISVNFSGMVSILGIIADDFEQRGEGTIAAISSVAGDRGRQSNYIYGSAKAGLTAFLSGLRNRLAPYGVHVMTIKPGFCRTRMTENLDLPAVLTATPQQIAESVYRGMQKKYNTIYALWMWRWIMLVIRLIPEFVFRKMKL